MRDHRPKSRDRQHIHLLSARFDQRLSGRGDCAAGRVHTSTNSTDAPSIKDGSSTRKLARPIEIDRLRPCPRDGLGRFDPNHRAIVKPQSEFSRISAATIAA